MKKILRAYLQIFCCTVLPISLTSCKDDNVNPEPPLYKHNTERMIIIGDIQEYTYNHQFIPYLDSTVDWIINQPDDDEDFIVSSVICVGDVTNNNYDWQWGYYRDHVAKIANYHPFYVITGNHDYDWDSNYKIPDRKSTRLNEYYTVPKYHDIEYFEEGRAENMVVDNYIFDQSYYLMCLEFAPRPEVLDWAENIIKNHPDRRYILATHAIITRYGEPEVLENCCASSNFYNPGVDSSDGVTIINRLMKPYNNVAFAICGHNGFSQNYTFTNDAGRKVTVVLYNLQYEENGGNGMVQYIDFDRNSNMAKVSTYNTVTKTLVPTLDDIHKYDYTFSYK